MGINPKQPDGPEDEDTHRLLEMRALRIEPHGDAGPRTGRNLNAPRRTRTFEPLIKSRLQKSPDGAEKADSEGRVSEFVNVVSGPQAEGGA